MKLSNFNILRVCYNPKLSCDAEEHIREAIAESMISSDHTSAQYQIDSVLDQLSTRLPKDDLAIIQFLQNNSVQYIEF